MRLNDCTVIQHHETEHARHAPSAMQTKMASKSAATSPFKGCARVLKGRRFFARLRQANAKHKNGSSRAFAKQLPVKGKRVIRHDHPPLPFTAADLPGGTLIDTMKFRVAREISILYSDYTALDR